MRTGTFRPRSAAWVSMAVICCLFPSARKTRWRTRSWGSRRSASSNAAAIVSSMDSVMEADTHFVAGFRPGVRLAAGGQGPTDALRLADGGGEVGDGDDLGHLLRPPGACRPPSGVPAVLRAHGDALAVALHHDHVAVRLLFFFRVAGAFLVEVARPGGEVFREPGELGAAADRDAGAGLDDLLGLPEPAAGQVKGRQGAHAEGVRVTGQDLPGVGGVQVRLAPVPVGHPGDPDRPEHAGHAPSVPFLHDPCRIPAALVTPPAAARGRCRCRTWPAAAAAAAPGPCWPITFSRSP